MLLRGATVCFGASGDGGGGGRAEQEWWGCGAGGGCGKEEMMDEKEDGQRQESLHEGVGGLGERGGPGRWVPLPPPRQGGRVCFLGVNPQRSRKEPKRLLLKLFLKTYCVLWPRPRAGQGRASSCPKEDRVNVQGRGGVWVCRGVLWGVRGAGGSVTVPEVGGTPSSCGARERERDIKTERY